MNSQILRSIGSKSDYMTTLEAITGGKTAFTEEEKEKLLDIYADNAKNKFGLEDVVLVKAVLALDVPGANLLGQPDAEALSALAELYKDWDSNLTKVEAVKTAALSGDVSASLALALARAALDTYATQADIAKYRDDITALADLLKGADEAAFADASVFLIRVRERVRNR